MLDLHKAACLLKVLAILMSVGIVDTNTARNVRTGAFYRSIVILPGVIRLLGTCSGNL